ncbi:acyltransferase family protein [Clostridium intestinale]|uniref:Acyltransferase n=1 Tax=Clostridium intestinale TaxID=36845 RepID=A0A7D6VNL6_9CLOT|nr:acyltransferase [Clostridium intestinale]QLY78028.1 acyltransferase [Clostridium intestinale]
MKKERLFYLDFIRALSMIIIVIFHFNCTINQERLLGNRILPVLYANGDFGQIGVSLFFIISGASLMYAYENKFSLIEYFKKRFIKLYPMFYIAYFGAFLYLFYISKSLPYVIPMIPKWTFIYTILGIDGYMINTLPDYYLLGEWFLGCILFIYLLFPILRRIIIKYPKLLFMFGLVFYIMVVERYNSVIRIDWNFTTRIFDVLIGMYFIKYIKKISVYQFIFGLLISGIMLYRPLNITGMYKITIIGIALFVTLVYIAQWISNERTKNIFEKMSKYSYPVFLVHHIALGQVVLHFRGATLRYIEVFFVLIICCIVIGLTAFCLNNINDKLLQIFFAKRENELSIVQKK